MSTHALGCGTYRVMVLERGGQTFVTELEDVTELSFNRILNETSEANITVTSACCGALANVNPWEHEVAIYRNGQQVWVGPIIDMDFVPSTDSITLYAKDLITWADHRLVELADRDYDPEETDLADAYVWLLEHAYCKDPWGMTWYTDPIGIPVAKFYPSFDKVGGERWGGAYPTCGDEMRTLSEAGVDYTVVNRHLWGGSVSVVNPVSSGVVLLDQHFAETPTIKVAGSKMATRVASAGGGGGYYGYYDDQMAIYPRTTGPITPDLLNTNQTQYGLLETFSTTDQYDEVDTTVTKNPLSQDVKSRWDLLRRPYVYVSDARLDPSAPLVFNEDLIPGGVFQILLSSTCRELTEPSVRLKEVSVSLNGTEESVSVTLTPVGTTSVDLVG